MRSGMMVAAAIGLIALAGCGGGNRGVMGRAGPDEFAVARRAPLVIPPDFALVPPRPGAPRPQEADSSTQALQAMFGGPAPRSASEAAMLQQAGSAPAAGIRSDVAAGQPTTVDKGGTTADILSAPISADADAQVTGPQ